MGGASAITDKNFKKKKTTEIRLETEIERAMYQYGMKQNDGSESHRVLVNTSGGGGLIINQTIQDSNNSHISM